MIYYADLRQYLQALDERGRLHTFTREVVRETEMASLVMLQYRGVPQSQWRSFLFENVVDVKGRRYANQVLMGSPASREILSIGLTCSADEIKEKWSQGCLHPLEPEIVETGPVHEVVLQGKELEVAGLEAIGAPVELPGFSGSVRTTTPIVTKDPDTGIRNFGQYSAFFAGKTEMRVSIAPSKQGTRHHSRSRQLGKALQLAIVVGATPNLDLAAAAPLPYGVDEYAVAGGIVGEPVKLVKCRTVDLEVPATAEMVIEGELTEQMEAQAPFGDWPGYLYEVGGYFAPVMKVTCITHRRNPIFVGYDIGYPPTSTTVMSSTAIEISLFHHLRQALHMPGILDLACHYAGGGRNYVVIQMKKSAPWDPWQALNALTGYEVNTGKIAIVVDDDIDPRDPEAVNWALAFRMQPHRDMRIITHRCPLLDTSAYPPNSSAEERYFPPPSGASAVLIDATRKWPYAPVALPKQEHMERARAIWESEGLPALRLRQPWHGYDLGLWREEDAENARLVVTGEHAALWAKLSRTRVPLRQPFESQ